MKKLKKKPHSKSKIYSYYCNSCNKNTNSYECPSCKSVCYQLEMSGPFKPDSIYLRNGKEVQLGLSLQKRHKLEHGKLPKSKR